MNLAAQPAADAAPPASPGVPPGSALSPRLPGVLTADQNTFVAAFGAVVERSPWVVQRAWAHGPFASLEMVHAALCTVIEAASPAEQLALLNAHPELAGREALEGTMTPESNSEQARLGLLTLSPEQFARLTRLNAAYRTRFGYPLIIALRLHADLESVLQAGEARLAHEPLAERAVALGQINAVMYGRLFPSPAVPGVSARTPGQD